MHKSALVLFSGGQDSTTCLAWALEHFERVETIGFDYGQRHDIELTVRPNLREKIIELQPHWETRLGPDHMIDLSLLSSISETAMTSEIEIVMQENGLPNTFVPTDAALMCWSAACAKRIFQATPIVATTRLNHCKSRSTWA